MDNRFLIPKSTGDGGTPDILWNDGVLVFRIGGDLYKLAYRGATDSVYAALYEISGGVGIALTKNGSGTYEVWLVKSNGVYSTLVQTISFGSDYNGGGVYFQFNTILLSGEIIAFYTVFPTAFLALQAARDAELPGAVVSVTAQPTHEPEPSTDGVVVRVVAQLLDQNDQAGISDENTGDGTFDFSSDPVPIENIPTLSAVNAGLVALFKPTLSELQQLGSYLWTNITDFIENLNKLFMNPMDFLIALNIFPVSPSTGSAREINIGSFTTTITMSPLNSQWCDVNCGSVQVPKVWGNALDFAPNSRAHIMLPFIGSCPLDIDDIMGNIVGLRYRIDMLSGQCVAMITVNGDVYYQYTGQCSVSVPLTGADWSRVYQAAIGGGLALGITAAGAGATGATATVAASQAMSHSAETAMNSAYAMSALQQNMAGARGITAMRQTIQDAASMALESGNMAKGAAVGTGIGACYALRGVNNTVSQVMNGKATIQHSGSLTGSAGILGIRTPYIYIEYPNQSLAADYKHFVGYPSNMTATLGGLSGFTQVEQVISSGISGTDGELAELVNALKGGVYL